MFVTLQLMVMSRLRLEAHIFICNDREVPHLTTKVKCKTTIAEKVFVIKPIKNFPNLYEWWDLSYEQVINRALSFGSLLRDVHVH